MKFPERFLYIFSDLLYVLMYYVIGYRKKVVFENLRMAFPEYNKAEIRRTAKKFYLHLSDLILESGRSHFYSEARALKKITYRNPELINELYGTGKQVMAVLGHYGNWEYLSTLGLAIDYPVAAIYKPLRNKHMNKLVQRNRKTFGVITVPMEKIARTLITYKSREEPILTLFLGDQRPQFHKVQYWTKFLNLDTPVYLGTEKLARKMDAAVVFIKIRKKSRGRYEVEFELICKEPNLLEPHAITDAHVKILEDLIREEPAYWLWSHKRWKHSYERFLIEKEIKS